MPSGWSSFFVAHVGAILLLTASTGGYYWLALGAVTSIVVGVFDGWILLVEILR